jgi:hypothetical protein
MFSLSFGFQSRLTIVFCIFFSSSANAAFEKLSSTNGGQSEGRRTSLPKRNSSTSSLCSESGVFKFAPNNSFAAIFGAYTTFTATCVQTTSTAHDASSAEHFSWTNSVTYGSTFPSTASNGLFCRFCLHFDHFFFLTSFD